MIFCSQQAAVVFAMPCMTRTENMQQILTYIVIVSVCNLESLQQAC